MSNNTKRLVESAVLIALGTVLSLFSFSGFWALGGGITICSMLPLVLISQRYSLGWSLFTATVYAALQLILGFSNIQYAQNVWQMIAIILFDYIIAFGVIGFAGCFKGSVKNRPAAMVLGIVLAFILRFACHFISGWVIWEALWPNELGWAAPLWSFAYNGSYMGPEIVITAIVALLLYKPLKRYIHADDLR